VVALFVCRLAARIAWVKIFVLALVDAAVSAWRVVQCAVRRARRDKPAVLVVGIFLLLPAPSPGMSTGSG
jgi:uncharacterized membrane protein